MTHEEHMANLRKASRELSKAMDEAGKEGWIVGVEVDVSSEPRYMDELYFHRLRLSLRRFF